MKSLHWIFLLICGFAGLIAPAGATIISYNVNLDGTQSGSGSPASGFASLTLDDVADTLLINLTYAGLLSPTTNAHIHCCAAPGTNGPVIIPFIPGGFVTGTTSGSFANTFTLTALQVADIQSDLSYINIHTVIYPAGEIRGQIINSASVPEPNTLLLSLFWLFGLWTLRQKMAGCKAGYSTVP
jgi:hypothetical protein